MTSDPVELPAMAEVPIVDLPLWLAASYVGDAEIVRMLGPILAGYGIGYDDFWYKLTVGEFRRLVEGLQGGA